MIPISLTIAGSDPAAARHPADLKISISLTSSVRRRSP